MTTVSATASASQYGLQQLRLQQARRTAEQAEATARALNAQAGNAQRVADRAQEDARSLSVQANQAESTAGQARQGLAALSTAQQAFARLSNTADQVVAREPTPVAAAPVTTAPVAPTPAADAAPVVNTQGQVTGTVINTTA